MLRGWIGSHLLPCVGMRLAVSDVFRLAPDALHSLILRAGDAVVLAGPVNQGLQGKEMAVYIDEHFRHLEAISELLKKALCSITRVLL